MNNPKIGIYGDSFADGKDAAVPWVSWPNLLIEKFQNHGTNYAASGTSTYWSYEQFLSTHQMFDVIIFCYTTHTRWPALPEDLKGHHWNINPISAHLHHQFNPKIQKFNEVYHDLFPDRLLKFIDRNIFKSVNDICLEKNKFLINVFSFGETYELPATNFPIFTNLNQISFNEKIKINGEFKTFEKLIKEENIIDRRYCHLNQANNKLFSDLLYETMENKIKNKKTNVFTDSKWIEYDPSIQKQFEIE